MCVCVCVCLFVIRKALSLLIQVRPNSHKRWVIWGGGGMGNTLCLAENGTELAGKILENELGRCEKLHFVCR